jgi:antitoxin (DNA-binding transcriptional repressor) of toxin-antitoxin stability system
VAEPVNKAGKPVARLIPERPAARAIGVPGIDEGKLKIADDFDKMSRSELAQLYGPGVLSK